MHAEAHHSSPPLQSADGLLQSWEMTWITDWRNPLVDWWDPKGPMKPLHSYNALRSSFLRGLALSHLPQVQEGSVAGMRVVDVGCGGGILAECLCKMGLDVTAIDAARESPSSYSPPCAETLGIALNLFLRLQAAARICKLPDTPLA
jgi:hypothetical protein